MERRSYDYVQTYKHNKKDDFKTLIAFFHRLTLFVPILLFISEYLKYRKKRGKIDSKRVSN